MMFWGIHTVFIFDSSKDDCIYEHETALGCWKLEGKTTIKKTKIIYFVYSIPLLIAWECFQISVSFPKGAFVRSSGSWRELPMAMTARGTGRRTSVEWKPKSLIYSWISLIFHPLLSTKQEWFLHLLKFDREFLSWWGCLIFWEHSEFSCVQLCFGNFPKNCILRQGFTKRIFSRTKLGSWAGSHRRSILVPGNPGTEFSKRNKALQRMKNFLPNWKFIWKSW